MTQKTDHSGNPVIGWTIITGNPVQGFNHYGFYESEIEAGQTASEDTEMPPDWWIAPIYPMTKEE